MNDRRAKSRRNRQDLCDAPSLFTNRLVQHRVAAEYCHHPSTELTIKGTRNQDRGATQQWPADICVPPPQHTSVQNQPVTSHQPASTSPITQDPQAPYQNTRSLSSKQKPPETKRRTAPSTNASPIRKSFASKSCKTCGQSQRQRQTRHTSSPSDASAHDWISVARLTAGPQVHANSTVPGGHNTQRALDSRTKPMLSFPATFSSTTLPPPTTARENIKMRNRGTWRSRSTADRPCPPLPQARCHHEPTRLTIRSKGRAVARSCGSSDQAYNETCGQLPHRFTAPRRGCERSDRHTAVTH